MASSWLGAEAPTVRAAPVDGAQLLAAHWQKRPASGASVGGLLDSTDEVKAHFEMTHRFIGGVLDDFGGAKQKGKLSTPEGQALYARWKELYKEWLQFHSETNGSGIDFWNKDTILEKSKSFRRQAEEYRDALNRLAPGAGVTPNIKDPPPFIPPSLQTGLNVGGLLVVAGVVFVIVSYARR